MSRSLAITVALVCFALCGVCHAAETLGVGAKEDVYVRSTYPTTNYSSSIALYAGVSSATKYRSYLKFELTGLPEGAEVKKASVTVWSRRVYAVPTTVSVYGAQDGWAEKQVTWATAPPPEDTPSDTLSLNSSVVAPCTWDVTPIAAAEAEGDGVVTLVLAESSPQVGSCVWFADSIDGSVPGARLDVEYEAGAPVDETPPEIELDVLKPKLWPANHELVLAATVSATDPPGVPLEPSIGVTSNEPINGKGDGNTDYDWEVIRNGDVWEIWLRAERSGQGDGRTYTITVGAADAAGNAADDVEGTVLVPHDQGNGKQKGR